jgi:uncharacterized protein
MGGKFLPGRYPIEDFGAGGFRFGAMSHRGSLLILSGSMHALMARDIEAVLEGDLAGLQEERKLIDFMLVGTGALMRRLPRHLADWFHANDLRYDAMATAAAVRTYNVLLAEERRIAALLIAVN